MTTTRTPRTPRASAAGTGTDPDKERHERLQQLMQDRRSSTKGRVSVAMPLILDGDIAMKLTLAKNRVSDIEGELAEHETAHKDAHKGDVRQGGRIPPPPPPAELTKRYDEAKKEVEDLEDAAADVTVRLVFVAMKHEPFDKLVKEHPPRDGDDDDAEAGFNRDTFPDARMRACAAKVLDYDDNLLDLDIDGLIEGMSDGEHSAACQIAGGVNLNQVAVPFSAANSPRRQRSGGKSK